MSLKPTDPWTSAVISRRPLQEPGQPLSPNGIPLAPELNPVDVGNPMAFPDVGDGNFVSQSAEEVQQANLSQAMGKDSGDGFLGQSFIDMEQANACYDEPSKGGIAYGRSNTGRES